ncbi:MAG: cation:proton antiporter, partial [Fervidobacterium sp.]
MWLLGYNTAESFFIGVILTATSVGITVAILDELNVIERKFAKTIIGAAVVDDILGLFALSIGTSIAISKSFSFIDTGRNIVITLLVLSFSVFIGIKILSVMRFVQKFKIDKSVVYLILFGMVLLSFIFAEDIGLSGIVGAFFAGLIVSESGFQKEERRFEHMIDPLVVLFSPLFFLNLGLLVNFHDLVSGFSLGIILTVVAIASKYFGCYYGAKKSGMDQLDSMLVGFGMLPRGEVALIAAQIGLTANIISPSIFSALIIMTLLTSLLPPLIFFYALTPYT